MLPFLIFVLSCEKTNLETKPKNLTTTSKIAFDELPFKIKTILNEINTEALKGHTQERGKTVKKDILGNKTTSEGGSISYTFALEKINRYRNTLNSPYYFYFENIVVKELKNGEFKIRILRYIPKESWFTDSQRDFQFFTGTIQFLDSERTKIGEISLENGASISKGNYQKANDVITCVYELDFIFCVGNSCTYYYNEKCTLTDGGSGGNSGGGTTTPTTGGTGDWSGGDENTGGGGSGGSSGDAEDNDQTEIETTPVIWEDLSDDADDKIDDTELKDCHSNLVETLKTIENGIVGNMIQKLAGSNSTDYNWKIDYNIFPDSNPNATASTNPVASSNSVATHLNLDRIQNSTDLSMGRTFVHESVHAFLTYQYRYDMNAKELNYSQLLNKYAKQYNTNANDTHHILYLKENLITPIAAALQEFGTKLGYKLPLQYYTDMAYGGLYSSSITNTIFENMVPNESDRIRIKNRLSAETDNKTVDGTAPEGKKACN